MKKIGLITYDTNHLKTEQICLRLLSQQKYKISIYALPFVQRKARETLFHHRPDQSIGVHPKVLCRAHGLRYVPCDFDMEIADVNDYWLITGAGILPKSFIMGKRIINCHPGLIPLVRGLDSFKWALLDGEPIGITLHFIDEQVDQGELLCTVETPVYKEDDFEGLARRHYELEIDLLARFEEYLEGTQINKYDARHSRRRMPVDMERLMIARFDSYLNDYGR